MAEPGLTRKPGKLVSRKGSLSSNLNLGEPPPRGCLHHKERRNVGSLDPTISSTFLKGWRAVRISTSANLPHGNCFTPKSALRGHASASWQEMWPCWATAKRSLFSSSNSTYRLFPTESDKKRFALICTRIYRIYNPGLWGVANLALFSGSFVGVFWRSIFALNSFSRNF